MLRFYGNLTQEQIGDRLGISQMHVSRLLERALAYLRAQITGPAGNDMTGRRHGWPMAGLHGQPRDIAHILSGAFAAQRWSGRSRG